MSEYFSLEEAFSFMKEGKVLSSLNSDRYDYFKIENGSVIGFWSCCDDEEILNEYILPKDMWYLI